MILLKNKKQNNAPRAIRDVQQRLANSSKRSASDSRAQGETGTLPLEHPTRDAGPSQTKCF